MMDNLLADRPGDRRGSGVHSRLPSFEPDAQGDRGITFPMFLTMMGEHLYDFDTEAELLAAFECFDENDTGLVKCDEIRKWLGDVGEKMDQHEVSLEYIVFRSCLTSARSTNCSRVHSRTDKEISTTVNGSRC